MNKTMIYVNHLMMCCIPESTAKMLKITVSTMLIIKGITLPLGPWLVYPKAYQILIKKIATPSEAEEIG